MGIAGRTQPEQTGDLGDGRLAAWSEPRFECLAAEGTLHQRDRLARGRDAPPLTTPYNQRGIHCGGTSSASSVLLVVTPCTPGGQRQRDLPACF